MYQPILPTHPPITPGANNKGKSLSSDMGGRGDAASSKAKNPESRRNAAVPSAKAFKASADGMGWEARETIEKFPHPKAACFCYGGWVRYCVFFLFSKKQVGYICKVKILRKEMEEKMLGC